MRNWPNIERRVEPRKPIVRQFELVVIGCSLGGMKALTTIFESLTTEFCVPIAVVQHRHKRSNEGLPSYFRSQTKLRVVDADDKQPIKSGHIYLAPADYHLLVERGEFSLSVDAAVAYSRPSIDVLFESAADAYRENLIGVILTGNNEDGTRGAKRIKQRGGLMIAQDPATAEAPSMPSSAVEAKVVDRILPLERIGPFLAELCRNTALVKAGRT